MRIISISGKKGHGKDAICEAVKAMRPAVKVAFADALKQEVAEFLVTHTWLEAYTFYIITFGEEKAAELATQLEKRSWRASPIAQPAVIAQLINAFNHPTEKLPFRLLLQLWGTEFRRATQDDYWLQAWDKRVAALGSKTSYICVPDCRFPNEYEHLANRGAVMLKVIRPSIDVDATSQHSSETALDGQWDWDYIVVNNGPLEDLQASTHRIIENIEEEDMGVDLSLLDAEPTVEIVVARGTIPTYADVNSAGADLYAAEEVDIPVGQIRLVKLGIKTHIPDGMYAQIYVRSGIASKRAILLASSGVIDSSYRGEWMVPLINLGENIFHVEKGDRIAQAVFQKYEHVKFEERPSLEVSVRGDGGFGSTGGSAALQLVEAA